MAKDKKRYLISAYYSDWVIADSEDEAIEIISHRVLTGLIKRHEWEVNAQEWDDQPNSQPESREEIRWCDQGCGYKLPEEYAEDETTCGACLNELEDTERRIKAKQRKMRGK